MPIYEFECPIHGVFEVFFHHILRDDVTEMFCDYTFTGNRSEDRCGEMCPRLVSATTMRPDKYWAGQVVHGKYVTKQSEVPANIAPATRETREWVDKRLQQNLKEREEKSSNNLINFLNEELAGVEISPDGYSQKERDNYVRARERAAAESTGD